jgi:hypothetical protein
MKKLKSLAFAGAAALMLSSCAGVMAPVTAAIYGDVSAPYAVTSNNVGTKVGTASAKSILGIVATGDASVNAAAQNAGITKISHVDYRSTHILGFIATFEVMVYGE